MGLEEGHDPPLVEAVKAVEEGPGGERDPPVHPWEGRQNELGVAAGDPCQVPDELVAALRAVVVHAYAAVLQAVHQNFVGKDLVVLPPGRGAVGSAEVPAGRGGHRVVL